MATLTRAALWLALASAAVVAATRPAHADATHAETLLLRPLPRSGKVLAHFHFATDEAAATSSGSLYPHVIKQILTKYDATTLRLSFAVGKYSDARYGPARAPGEPADRFHAPFGARLQVQLNGQNQSTPDALARWKGVTSELGGIFSASLNQMDETTLTGLVSNFADSSLARGRVLEASLAREELCTENMTPWLKMLPCRAHAGLGQLIDPIKILSGEYAMLAIDATRDTTTGRWSFDQYLTTVQPALRGWSLGSVFFESGKSEQTRIVSCPLAQRSVIRTDQAIAGSAIATTSDLILPGDGISTVDPWVQGTQETATLEQLGNSDVVSVHRFQTGYGQVHGGIAVRFDNRDSRCAVHVTYKDVAPWYLRLYFHTFKSRVTVVDEDGAVTESGDGVADVVFAPAELRGRPNEFRVAVELPPRSSVVVSVQFDKVFVRLSEHPPDANRGFDVPAGVATFVPVASSATACSASEAAAMAASFSREQFTEPLLVALPTPDFSMPYNVITLSSTVVAFFIGSLLNTLLRKAPRIKRMLAADDAVAQSSS